MGKIGRHPRMLPVPLVAQKTAGQELLEIGEGTCHFGVATATRVAAAITASMAHSIGRGHSKFFMELVI